MFPDAMTQAGESKFYIMTGCQGFAIRAGWLMHTPTLAFVRVPEGGLFGDPHVAARSRSALWVLPDFPESGSASNRLPSVREGETQWLEFLLKNALRTARLSCYVRRRCHTSMNGGIAKELSLD